MNERKNLLVRLCAALVLTPESHLSLPLCFAKCSPTQSPPGLCCARFDFFVYLSVHVRVCLCVRFSLTDGVT